MIRFYFFFFQAEDGIRDGRVSRVQTCALPIFSDLDDSVADQPQLDAEALLLHREHVPVRIVPLFAESSNKSYFAALFGPDSFVDPSAFAHGAHKHVQPVTAAAPWALDRKSTRLNSSHPSISY